jgi:hypothetical protein
MSDQKDDEFRIQTLHIGMWKHYDKLRQEKNTSFLQANNILVLVFAGLVAVSSQSELLKEHEAHQFIVVLLFLVSSLGALVCAAWFLLLTRNSAYIKKHRDKSGEGFKEGPGSWTPPSRYLDRIPALAFLLFWLLVLWSFRSALKNMAELIN